MLNTKIQVQQLAKELNYEPNQSALFFKQQKTHSIGVILHLTAPEKYNIPIVFFDRVPDLQQPIRYLPI